MLSAQSAYFIADAAPAPSLARSIAFRREKHVLTRHSVVVQQVLSSGDPKTEMVV
jgi:hypothetical protein